MRIKKSFASFTGQIEVGRRALFLEISKNGSETMVDDLVKDASHFNYIVLYGQPFLDKQEVAKFIKKLAKINTNVSFQINTPGLIRPVGVGSYTNIIFNVLLKLKNSKLDYDERINPNIIKWFVEIEANFIFDIHKGSDVDEVIMLINMVNIPKRLVYLSPRTGDILDVIINKALKHGFNIAPDFRMFLWENIGGDNNE